MAIDNGDIGGVVELDSQQLSMAFPLVYEQPLPFESATGRLQWRLENNRVFVDSGPLNISTEHGPVTALLDLDLPTEADDELPPTMDLTIGLRDTPAAYRDRYIPYILSEDFRRWLATSITAGQVIDGAFLYRGSLRKGDTGNRTVQLYFNVADAELDYHPDWPGLTAIDGVVVIDDADVDVLGRKANIFGLDVASAEVHVSTREEQDLWLTVAAQAVGDSRDALRIVNESMINNFVGGAFNSWELAGKADAAIKLDIPLAGTDEQPVIDVAVDLSASTLSIPDYRVKFDHLNGRLNYNTGKGISAVGITARFFEKPVQLQVAQNDGNVVVVDINSSVDMRDVQSWSQQAAVSFTSGVADFNAQVRVAPEGGDSLFTIQSDLAGVAIDLPAPYAKTAESALPFLLELPIGQLPSLLTMKLAETAELQLIIADDGVTSGVVVLGEAQSLQHEEGFLTVVGAIDNMNYDQWQPVFNRYLDADKALAETRIELPEESVMSVKVRDFSVAQFDGFELQFESSIINAIRQSDTWWLAVENEVLAGELVIADDASLPLRANLQRLKLPGLEENEIEPEKTTEATAVAAAVTDDETSEAAMQPQKFSALNLDLDIEQLSFGEQDYGSIAGNIRGSEEQLLINNLSMDIRGLKISPDNPATMEWMSTETGQQTRFSGLLEFANIGDSLEQWSYERVVESKRGQLSVDFTWPGAPNEWSLNHSEGSIYLQLKDGRFLKASGTASGTLKVVGIVNFTNILRRLQLDFSDVSNKGIAFDQIEGEAILEDSRLVIVDDLVIKSPSSSFALRGDADMLAKQLDMDLSVTLPVASNLPWIAALAGGLPTAAGVYVASKIFEKQVDRFSSAVYSVKGDWNDPALTFKRVFDDSKSFHAQAAKKAADKAAEKAAENADSEVNSEASAGDVLP
ncbi:YhdP family protein [Oceanicoccus sp. KOV_DT_Chl]|uniref:YhdP family phospholipid transporter n=1 Tax=Oceanicoccus sp. KOV_DT_Chl TaxID=1904639 RepID=UPI000C7C1F49|nr:AsmA-like C-terminal region-containing protein [Oceanicoccus sp. KOV_DT_Chl]